MHCPIGTIGIQQIGNYLQSTPKGSRSRSRPKRTWTKVAEKDCQARNLNKEHALDRSRWRKLIQDMWWSGWVWVGECFFWYRPSRVVPYKEPLNGCVCACVKLLTMYPEKNLMPFAKGYCLCKSSEKLGFRVGFRVRINVRFRVSCQSSVPANRHRYIN